jgi:uncharacterized membrane protein
MILLSQVQVTTMENVNYLLLILHMLSGGLALVLGSTILFLKKGNSTHRTNGKIFFYTMLLAAISAIGLSLSKYNPFLLSIAIFSAYMTLEGKDSIRNKTFNTTKSKYLIWITALINGMFMLISGNLILLVFGIISTFLIAQDLYLFFYIRKRGKIESRHFLERHIGMMMGSFISTFTAFLVVNFNSFEPNWIIWLLPTIVGVPLLIYWSTRHPLIKSLKSV